MHALREFIQEAIDARGWTPADFSRETGLSRQLVSQLLNDNRDVLTAALKPSTIQGIARGLRVQESTVARHMFVAMGYDLGTDGSVDLARVKPEALLQELEIRLLKRPREDVVGDAAPIAPVVDFPPAPPADAAARTEHQPPAGQRLRDTQDEDAERPWAARPGHIDRGEAGDMTNVGEENQDLPDNDEGA